MPEIPSARWLPRERPKLESGYAARSAGTWAPKSPLNIQVGAAMCLDACGRTTKVDVSGLRPHDRRDDHGLTAVAVSQPNRLKRPTGARACETHRKDWRSRSLDAHSAETASRTLDRTLALNSVNSRKLDRWRDVAWLRFMFDPYSSRSATRDSRFQAGTFLCRTNPAQHR